MGKIKLKILIENELYPLVLANSHDQIANISFESVRSAINEFMERYKKELTEENIDFLTEYIWFVINKVKGRSNLENER